MLKPYNRNIRDIDTMLNNTYIQSKKKKYLKEILRNCLFHIKYTVTDSYCLSSYEFNTNRYCIILNSYNNRTEIDVYSPRTRNRHMYRVETVYPYLCDFINPMYEYYVPRSTLYIIETNYKNLEQIKQVIRGCDHA